MPKCSLAGGDELEVVEEIKLLGVMITSDLKWNAHCDFICQKAFARLWMLRRLKPLGASVDVLLEIYVTQIRNILEFAVAAWNSGLTKIHISQLERVQKCAFAIILEKNYLSYDNALNTLEMRTLSERRHDLCLKFATKSLKHDKFSHWFCENDSKGVETRSIKPNLIPAQARLQIRKITSVLPDQVTE
jgi:hypothetical protein